MAVDLIVARHYHEGDIHKVERVTWRHLPVPDPMWRWQSRRFRKPKLVEMTTAEGPDAAKGRPLPGWCAPDYAPNRWIWIRAANPAADLASIAPDGIGEDEQGIVHFHSSDSVWWSLYEIPLRVGCVLVPDPRTVTL